MRRPWLALAACAAMLIAQLPVGAQELSQEVIRCRLDPGCPKPGFRNMPFGKRGVETSGEAQETPNSVSFKISFAYDSTELQNDSLITLEALAGALSHPSLKAARFLIAGHTDARGSEAYNQKLSERRAQAVANHLVSQFRIERHRLTVQGFGKQRLYDPARPEDEVNRRVQVINLTETAR